MARLLVIEIASNFQKTCAVFDSMIWLTGRRLPLLFGDRSLPTMLILVVPTLSKSRLTSIGTIPLGSRWLAPPRPRGMRRAVCPLLPDHDDVNVIKSANDESGGVA